MGPFVLDASVALKWFLPEVNTTAAFRLRDVSTTLHVPDFFLLEFAHVACMKQRRRELPIDDALQIIRIVESMPLLRHPDVALRPRALELALQLTAGLYDCMYLALAVELDCRFVTADRRFMQHVGGTKHAHRILWIEDIPASS